MASRPRLRPLALVVLFTATSAIGLAHPQPTLAWSSNTFSSTSERELVALTNRARAAAGLRSLKVDSTLTSVARWRSKDMIVRDYFSHDIPGYGRVFKKLDSIGYCYKLAGENIGWNTYPDDQATAEIQRMFMDSPSHRANILGKTWDVIGVGAYKGSDGKKMWTVLFADKCGGSTATKATPKPTPKPTVRPKPLATPRPTPRPTPAPTAAPSPTPTAAPTPTLTTPRLVPFPDDEVNGRGRDGDAGPPPGRGPHGSRIVEPARSAGLIDSIVGSVAGLFFGA